MNFSDKLKEIRKSEGLSQEQLAEKIGVSRQAITKWETGKGLPDIENVAILAEIFKVTIDELIRESVSLKDGNTAGCTSETVYDIDGEKHFDIKLMHAKRLFITSGSDEKLHITLKSDTLENLGEIFKVKIDEHRNCLDADCVMTDKYRGISNRDLEEALEVEVSLPRKLSGDVEINASVKTLELSKLDVKELEFDGDAAQTVISGSSGRFALTTKTDMEITADTISGSLELYQFRAKSVLRIPEAECPAVNNKGRKCEVFFMKDGKSAEFTPTNGENAVIVTGIGSQLTVELN